MTAQSVVEWVLATLAAQSVYAIILFGVVLALSAIRRPRTAHWRVALWSLVFIRFVLPVDLGFPFAIGGLLPNEIEIQSVSSSEPSFPVVPETGRVANEPSGNPASSILISIWLAGMSVLALRHMHLRRKVVRSETRSRTIEGHPANAILDRWRRRLRISRAVALKSSARAFPPFTAGVFRPAVFLPEDLLESADEQTLEAIIAHELVHVKRFDDLRLQVVAWIRIAYFFHPVAWIAESRLRQAREELCDEIVLRSGRLSPCDYGRGLLAVVQLRLSGKGASVVPAMSQTRRNLYMRFHRIASHVNVSRRSLLAARLASIILALVILPMAPAAATDPSTIATSSSVEPASATNTVSLLNPVPGARVTSPWGAAKDPWTGKPRHHRGIDLGAPVGTEIVAPADGRVIMATTSVPDGEALGTVIVLDHGDGLTTFYAHLGELDVTEGDRVEAGQVIATVGVTGKTTGPHLHFEVRAGGEPVDPASFIPF